MVNSSQSVFCDEMTADNYRLTSYTITPITPSQLVTIEVNSSQNTISYFMTSWLPWLWRVDLVWL